MPCACCSNPAPAISGLTFRVHGESGVEEGSYEFWKTVFDGVATCGRTVEIDMHAKGMDQTMIDLALATGLPATISPKYWAEHLGMPYHQADIRQWERMGPTRKTSSLMKLSDGSRSFMRYGYGDLLREDRKWRVVHRIWPGTQRLLLWGDPTFAAAYSRAFTFCSSDGVELMEPLSFKGRRGSGLPGGRCAYADDSLTPRWDWEKFLYTYRIWGRLLYNPDCDSEVWRRDLTHHFGAGASAMESALAHASRILPIVTTAHSASAANSGYWPELYLNQSLFDAETRTPYRDSPPPHVFGNVTPLDPQLFSKINEFADAVLAGQHLAKVSPIEVAQWLDDHAIAAMHHLSQALTRITNKTDSEWKRWRIDIEILAGLGRFFSAKFRSGVLYRLFEQTNDRTALQEAIRLYRAARSAWAELADVAKAVYAPDITVGESPQLRGHWLDRLPAIDQDIAALEAKLSTTTASQSNTRIASTIAEALDRPQRPTVSCRHTSPSRFTPGHPIQLDLALDTQPMSVRLYYRHVNQSERFEDRPMDHRDGHHRATIPSTYTTSPYPLQYYFEIRQDSHSASLYPGFALDLTTQPYFLLRPKRS